MQTFASLGQRAAILHRVLDVLINVQVTGHVPVLAVHLLLVLVLVLRQVVVRRRGSGGQQRGSNLILNKIQIKIKINLKCLI